MSTTTEALLKTHLEACVPIQIADYRSKGGPSEEDFGRVRTIYPTEIGSHGDAVLYREKEQTGRIMHMLVDGLAVLSFCPGGVTAFGLHFEAQMPVCEGENAETPVPTNSTTLHQE